MADRISRVADRHLIFRGADSVWGDPQYDHDGITACDLVELGLAAPTLNESEPHAVVAGGVPDADRWVPLTEGIAARLDSAREGLEQGVAEPVREEGASGIDMASEGELADEEPAGFVGWGGDLADADDFEEQDGQGWGSADGSLDDLWLEPVPDVTDEVPGWPPGTRRDISAGGRAIQLALAFVQSEGISSASSVDLLADIVLERGWSSVQVQVRGLVRAGYEIAQIHRMFELTDAWLHCVDSDTLAPERWHGGKRLTWAEAAQLLDFVGHDADLDQIVDFLADEREIWQGLRRDSGQLATFKNYLFGYRLSPRTQVDDGIWQINLDPDDARSFDGTRNPLCDSVWWDEPLEGHAWTFRQLLATCHDMTGLADWLDPVERAY